jgi:ABC-type transport system involved in multi-copper enzyme maturation permease subunit
VRESRIEWSFGKFIGQTLMVAVALAASSFGAAAVAFCRLSPSTATELFLPMLDWGFRAWIYSLAWIGLALGISHLTRSPGKRRRSGYSRYALWACCPLC